MAFLLDRVAHPLAAYRPEHLWWVDAEILAALATGTAGWGPRPYEDALAAFVYFLLAHVVDPEDGACLHTVDAEGVPLGGAKIGTWKDAFHEVRATTLLIEAFASTSRAG